MRVLVAQIHIPAIDSRDSQRAHVETVIQRLSAQVTAQPVDLIVLPELSTMEYSKENFQQVARFREPLEGEFYTLFGQFCREHKVAICYGTARQDGEDTYISQVTIGRQGQYLTHYDKLHTAEYGDSHELRYFRRGDHLSVFEIDGIKVGVIICYDMRFPELTRRLCREFGVDVILHPVAFSKDLSYYSWHQFVTTRALENQVYFLSVNRSGEHFGQSFLCPPWIDDTLPATVLGESEEFHLMEVDPRVISDARARLPFRKDVLEDYSALPVCGTR
ncbi:carbon-nitrogen hydrolase family protein [Halomonas icarae]|uniref:Carbon-nitrogen hydrolase family protein n=1 Tax=Halomonas icarae TaxID=2691040 RepID=A0A7X4W1E2_9GAMM|nr:carbon-nitrogen hydrolase family protein [Halomonas icarae]MDR5902463.1 carbon-nitrogen hydrolase family protein [Halomonas icarae]NAW14121.1 carbon-nitrogen hydrolase family protein [Halomonas icarae]